MGEILTFILALLLLIFGGSQIRKAQISNKLPYSNCECDIHPDYMHVWVLISAAFI